MNEGETEFVRICRNCDSVLGTVRGVLHMKVCPECEFPIVPVEVGTRSILVARAPRDLAGRSVIVSERAL